MTRPQCPTVLRDMNSLAEPDADVGGSRYGPLMEMVISAVTANLGCASPSAVRGRRVAAAVSWGEQERERGTDLIFAQEIPSRAWLDEWVAAGYQVAPADGPQFKVRSGLIWKAPIMWRQSIPVAADYHGSYVAAAGLELPGFAFPIAALSVHASPRPITRDELATYESLEIGVPTPRSGGGKDNGRLFDSDMLLHTLAISRLVHPSAGFLVAGDFNECLGWDTVHNQSWGELYFDQVRRHGLIPVVAEQWGEERRTQYASSKPAYQLDHILATPETAAILGNATVDPWDLDAAEAGAASDHAPIRFTLSYTPD